MKTRLIVSVSVLFLVLFCARPAPACTMIMAAKNGRVLAGNNEDWRNPNTRYTVVPAEAGRFGCIHFGFDDGYPQGGMNEHGLFIDGNAVAPTGWKVDPNKKPISRHLLLDILQTCATVADVRAYFEKYNTSGLARARFPVADREGRSMVVEYAQGAVRFVTEPTWFQVSTNFLRTDFPGRDVPCNRFRLAEKMMASAETLDLDLIRAVLSATHQEGDYPTQYSNIYDLKAGTVAVYLFHDFEKAVTLNLSDELKKGAHTAELASLFPILPHAAKVFMDQQMQPGFPVLREAYEAKGAAAVLARYEQMRREVRWVSKYDIGENEILKMITYLKGKDEAAAALSMAQALALSFPDSWRAHEAIGRAHLALGHQAEAIASFRRSLEINPRNSAVVETLKDLEKKK